MPGDPGNDHGLASAKCATNSAASSGKYHRHSVAAMMRASMRVRHGRQSATAAALQSRRASSPPCKGCCITWRPGLCRRPPGASSRSLARSGADGRRSRLTGACTCALTRVVKNTWVAEGQQWSCLNVKRFRESGVPAVGPAGCLAGFVHLPLWHGDPHSSGAKLCGGGFLCLGQVSTGFILIEST